MSMKDMLLLLNLLSKAKERALVRYLKCCVAACQLFSIRDALA
jgi:hypothetical protein